jgi:hypothetical protein
LVEEEEAGGGGGMVFVKRVDRSEKPFMMRAAISSRLGVGVLTLPPLEYGVG